jgi:predicted thioesterase
MKQTNSDTSRTARDLLPNVPVRERAAYRKPVPLTPGLSASATLVVEDADTACAIGSGDVPVLATPRVIALAERAAMEAVVDDLDAGTTTVGYEVQLTHLAPTPPGVKVTAEAILELVDGRRLTYRVSVTDARGLVAAGRITRVVVVRDRFVERANVEG